MSSQGTEREGRCMPVSPRALPSGWGWGWCVGVLILCNNPAGVELRVTSDGSCCKADIKKAECSDESSLTWPSSSPFSQGRVYV